MREMKDSGVEWIGKIPKDWKLERLQWHLDEIAEKNDPIVTTQVLSLTNKKGVIPYEEKGAQGNVAKESYDGYKIAYPNTIVANSMNILIGSVGYSNYYGCVSPVYYVFKEKENNDLRFINYIMQTTQFQKELKKFANGILEIRLRVSSANIFKRKCAFPCFEQQSRIANYLDSKCFLIDDFIDKQQNVIEKLREYKYSCYSEIIEKHSANTVSLGKVIEKVEQGWSPSPSERQSENGWKVLTLAAVKFGQFNQTEYKPFDGNEEKCERLLLNSGDFLLTRSNTRDLVGQVCIVDETKEKMIFSDLIYRISFYSEFILPEYALFAFQSPKMRQQISRDAHGSSSTMVKITHKDISNWEIGLPSLEEQELIVKELKRLDDSISKNIMNREKVIEKLMEYKKSLIYEVVTGKKEV